MNGNEQSIFAWHVVSRRRDRTEWRPPQNEFEAAYLHEVGEIRMAARELLDFDARVIERLAGKQLRQVLTQIVFERLQVELFTGPDWRSVGGL